MIQPVRKTQSAFSFLNPQGQKTNASPDNIDKRLWHEGATISEGTAKTLVRKYGTSEEIPGLDLNKIDIRQNILDYYGEGTSWDDEFVITDEGLCCISLFIFDDEEALSEQESIRALRRKAQSGSPVYASELVNALTQIKK